MSVVHAPTDRRAALKARHRRAILDSCVALISERGGTRFSVDELAERADVSRRTIFNHFASLDDVVTTVCAERFDVVIDSFRHSALSSDVSGGGRASIFEEVAQALRLTDVPSVVLFLHSALGGFDDHEGRPLQIFQASFSRTAGELVRELVARYPEIDSLEVEVLVSSVFHGTGVIAKRWISATGPSTDDGARAVWEDLLERLLENIQAGYRPRH